MDEVQTSVSPVADQTPTKSYKAWVILGAIIVVLVGIAIGFKDKLFPQLSSSKYSAVFLTNAQVYFGKLSGCELKDVYYLELQSASASSTPQPHLIKMGSEIHAPESDMKINCSQILFTETLKDDGAVVKGIKSQN